jgi:dienelactone hydrolase
MTLRRFVKRGFSPIDFDFRHGEWARQVFGRGEGPAVIVIHEIPGLRPLIIRSADRLLVAGFSADM